MVFIKNFPFVNNWINSNAVVVRIFIQIAVLLILEIQLFSFKVWVATLGCIVVGILIAWFFEVGNSHIIDKLLRESYFESFTTVSIVMFATALLKGNSM